MLRSCFFVSLFRFKSYLPVVDRASLLLAAQFHAKHGQIVKYKIPAAPDQRSSQLFFCLSSLCFFLKNNM